MKNTELQGRLYLFIFFMKKFHKSDSAWLVFMLLFIMKCILGKNDWTLHAYNLEREVKIKKYLSSLDSKQESSASRAGRNPWVPFSHTFHRCPFGSSAALPTWMLNSAGTLVHSNHELLECALYKACEPHWRLAAPPGKGRDLSAKLLRWGWQP